MYVIHPRILAAIIICLCTEVMSDEHSDVRRQGWGNGPPPRQQDRFTFTTKKAKGATEKFNYDDFFTITTVVMDEVLTNVPDAEVYGMLNQDLGTYTPMKFEYYNFQHYHPPDKRTHASSDRCYDDYFKCIGNQIHPKYVCTMNDIDEYPDGKVFFNTVCEMFLDNCLRGMRYWFVVDYGICFQNSKKKKYFKVIPTRRKMLQSLLNKIYKKNTDKQVEKSEIGI